MKRTCAITAIVLFLSVWVMAQLESNSSSSLNQRPTSTATLIEIPQTLTDARYDRVLEGCVRNSHGTLTLTDVAGKIYQLQGDTAELARHAGQEATVIGAEEPVDASARPGAQPKFTVKKVELIARVCDAGK